MNKQINTSVKQEVSLFPAMRFYHRSQLAHTRAIQSPFYSVPNLQHVFPSLASIEKHITTIV